MVLRACSDLVLHGCGVHIGTVPLLGLTALVRRLIRVGPLRDSHVLVLVVETAAIGIELATRKVVLQFALLMFGLVLNLAICLILVLTLVITKSFLPLRLNPLKNFFI